MKPIKSVLLTACLFIVFTSICFGGEKVKVNEWEIESTKTVNSIVNEEKGQLVSTVFLNSTLIMYIKTSLDLYRCVEFTTWYSASTMKVNDSACYKLKRD